MESKHSSVSVRIRTADGGVEAGELDYGPNEERVRGVHIELRMPGREPLLSDGPDYFAALVPLRQQLETRGELLIVLGARPDVRASGMQRDMGLGLCAYRLSDERGPRPEVCNVFTETDPDAVGSVAEQQAWHAAWLDRRGMAH